MKRLIISIMLVSVIIGAMAQQHDRGGQQRPPLSIEKYTKDLKEFISNEARLTKKEEAEFFPVYLEMKKKQRKAFEAMKGTHRTPMNNEKACANAIRMKDKMDIEQKKIEQQYHEKFLKILPATKVFKVIMAEDKFHRQMLRKWSRNGNDGDKRHMPR